MPRLKPTMLIPPTKVKKMTQGAFNKQRKRLEDNGYTSEQVDNIIGATLNGRDKADVMKDFKIGMQSQVAKDVRRARKPKKGVIE